MSVTSELSRVQVTLSGPSDAVPIGFYFLENADIVGYKTVDGVDTLLVLNTDYTLAGAGAIDGGMAAMIGGDAGDVITFARNDALTQEEEFLYMGRLNPATVERGYDRIVMQVQRLALMVMRSIRLPITGATLAEVPLVARMGKLIGFNATTGDLELVDGADVAADAAAAQAAAAAAAASAALAASFTNLAFTALTGGGANALDGLVTAGGATPTNSVRETLTGSVGGGDLAIKRWVFVAGTNAEDGVSYVRPDDYNGATNARIWVSIG